MEKLRSAVERKMAVKLEARKAASTFRQLTIISPDAVDFSSNDFLSLSQSLALRNAFLQELQNHLQVQQQYPHTSSSPAPTPTHALGSGGSRLLDGNSPYADALEASIAAFHGALAGLLWNSGFDANAGLFAFVPQPGDLIVYDELIHASVHEGMRLTRAERKVSFKHNSLESLESVLNQMLRLMPAVLSGASSVFIALESVYSMDGDVAPLAEIVDLLDRVFPRGNSHVIIDEAHGTGVLGPMGRGLVCQLGLEDKIFARLHTFGKSLACSGAIVLCSPTVRSYLINYARPLIYTTFMPYTNLAAIKAAYHMLQSGQTQSLQENLHVLTKHLYHLLKTAILRRNLVQDTTSIIQAPMQCPQAPIVAIVTPHARNLAGFCQQAGFTVRAVVPPTVPTRRVRVCLHAGNTRKQIEQLVECIERWLAIQLGNGVLPSKGALTGARTGFDGIDAVDVLKSML